MPKYEGAVWQYFIKVPVSENGSKYKAGTCMFCHQSYVTNAARMEKHLVDKCTLCPASVEQIFRRTVIDLADPDPTDVDLLTLSSLSSDSSSSLKGPVASRNISKLSGSASAKITSFVDTLPAARKAELDSAFARALYSSALALSTTASEYWKEFFQLFRPAWSPPSRYQLSNNLLDAECNNIQSKVTKKIETADSLTIMSDGWTDVNGNSLINIIVAKPEPVFYSAIQSTTQVHTGMYISHILGDAIAKIGSDRVHALVTDNASNMKLTWKLLKERFPHLVIYGCLAHGINLLIKDIASIPTIQKLIGDAKTIIKFFRNCQVAKQILKKVQIENGGKDMALLLPVETRWGSQCAAIDSLLRTKNHLQMAIMHKEISSKIAAAVKRNLLDEENFWSELEKVNALIEPPSSLIKTIEGDRPNLSYFAMSIKRLFAELEENLSFLSADEEDILKASFDKRRDFLFHHIQLATHVLNPKIDNSQLSEAEEQKAIDTIFNQARLMNLDGDNILVDLGDFIGKSSIWANESVWEAAKNMTPTAWWKGFYARRELSKLAVIVLNLPTTAAACERNWSTFSNIKTVKRNRLDQDRTAKLVAIKYNLSLLIKKIDSKGNGGLRKLDEDDQNGNCGTNEDSDVDNAESEEEPEMEEEWLDLSLLKENT